jgi:hypothetical protein
MDGERSERRRAAAVDAGQRGARGNGNRQQRQERDQQPEANQQRHPAGGRQRHVQRRAHLAVRFVVRQVRVPRWGGLFESRFSGVVDKVLRLVQVFQHSGRETEKAQQKKNRQRPAHVGSVTASPASSSKMPLSCICRIGQVVIGPIGLVFLRCSSQLESAALLAGSKRNALHNNGNHPHPSPFPEYRERGARVEFIRSLRSRTGGSTYARRFI